jgi:hypothetical protein
MKQDRTAMDSALKKHVLPVLRSVGFKGSYPHLRRTNPDGIDLISFQFDKWGGAFVIEIARGPLQGLKTHWGLHLSAGKLRAWDVHPDHRRRIQAREGSGTDAWFRFDDEPVTQVAQQVLDSLPAAEAWWQAKAQEGNQEGRAIKPRTS